MQTIFEFNQVVLLSNTFVSLFHLTLHIFEHFRIDVLHIQAYKSKHRNYKTKTKKPCIFFMHYYEIGIAIHL
jgi:hypothetical protein